VEARLRRLGEVVARLRRYRDRGPELLRTDPDLQWLVERGLQLGCETVLDVGNHVVASTSSRAPETYEAILDALALEGALSADLRAELKGIGGLRNVLVHDYLDVDTARVIEALDRAPERFERFASEVHAWLAARA
jgi:uncharacterized protein YutE (UPF0331/DUF86 family)